MEIEFQTTVRVKTMERKILVIDRNEDLKKVIAICGEEVLFGKKIL